MNHQTATRTVLGSFIAVPTFFVGLVIAQSPLAALSVAALATIVALERGYGPVWRLWLLGSVATALTGTLLTWSEFGERVIERLPLVIAIAMIACVVVAAIAFGYWIGGTLRGRDPNRLSDDPAKRFVITSASALVDENDADALFENPDFRAGQAAILGEHAAMSDAEDGPARIVNDNSRVHFGGSDDDDLIDSGRVYGSRYEPYAGERRIYGGTDDDHIDPQDIEDNVLLGGDDSDRDDLVQGSDGNPDEESDLVHGSEGNDTLRS